MKVRSYTAVAMLASGVGLSIAGFIAPPFGEISDSVLWLRLRREPAHARHCSCKHGIALAYSQPCFAQCLIYAGTALGFDVMIEAKLRSLTEK